MGTQWVVRSKEADRDDFSSRPGYRPRHAKSRRQQQRINYPGGYLPAPTENQGPGGQFEPSGYPPASIRQALKDRAATFVKDRSRRYGDEDRPHPGSG